MIESGYMEALMVEIQEMTAMTATLLPIQKTEDDCCSLLFFLECFVATVSFFFSSSVEACFTLIGLPAQFDLYFHSKSQGQFVFEHMLNIHAIKCSFVGRLQPFHQNFVLHIIHTP